MISLGHGVVHESVESVHTMLESLAVASFRSTDGRSGSWKVKYPSVDVVAELSVPCAKMPQSLASPRAMWVFGWETPSLVAQSLALATERRVPVESGLLVAASAGIDEIARLPGVGG